MLRSLRFFVITALRDLKRHKLHYCVAFSTVLLVVLSTLIVQTLVERGPTIFLHLSEINNGEIDAYLTPINGDENDSGRGKFVNFTALNYLAGGSNFKISPRKVLKGLLMNGGYYEEADVYVIDSARERDIGIGKRYTYADIPLGPRECIVKRREKRQEESISILVSLSELTRELVGLYNNY